MTFNCNLSMKKTLSAINTSETARRSVEDLVIFTLIINIENADDKNKVAVVDFELNDFVISVEGNGFDGKWKKLFSQQNVMLSELMNDFL